MSPAVPLEALRYGPPTLEQARVEFTGFFEQYASLDHARPHLLASPAGGRLPTALSADEVHRWYAMYKDIDHNDRRARFEFLETGLVKQFRGMFLFHAAELRNCLAIALIAHEGLWDGFLNADHHRRFRSANHFLQTYLQMWGLGNSATRVSRLRSSAEFWLRLKDEGLPVPDSLSRLECLSTRLDRVEVYRELVGSRDEAPSDWAIKSKVAELRARPVRVRPRKESKAAERCRLAKELEELVGALTPDMAAIKQKTAELVATYAPSKPRRRQPRLPTYNPARSCPIQLLEKSAEFRIEVISLPKPMVELVQKEGANLGWPLLSNRDGSFSYAIERTATETAENHARRNWLNHWADSMCTKLGAPPPRLLVAPASAATFAPGP